MIQHKFFALKRTAFLTAILCLLLAGCANQQAEQDSSQEPTDAVGETDTLPMEVEQESSAILFRKNFSEDRAWIKYEAGGNSYWAVIDTKGNAIIRFPADTFGSSTDFLDGYSHIGILNGHRYIIDPDGNVVREYDYNKDDKLVLEEKGGYVVTVKDISGFESKGYQYTICSPEGSALEQFELDSMLDKDQVSYCGKGVFKFNGIGYYCVQGHSWTENSREAPEFYSDTAIISTTYHDVDNSPYGNRFGGIVTLSVTGEANTIYSKYIGQSIDPSVIIDNVCVLYDFESESDLTALNLSTLEEYPLPEEYGSKMWNMEKEIYSPYDNRIVVHMKGSDGKGYTCVFDTQMNLLFGPIAGYAKAYSDGRMVLSKDDPYEILVYNVDGTVVFSLSEKGYKTSERYSSGVLLVCDPYDFLETAYLDTEGNLICESINSEKVITFVSSAS